MRTSKRKVRGVHKHQKDQNAILYCASCMQRLQPYECAMNFQQSQRDFESNQILQSFQQLSHDQ